MLTFWEFVALSYAFGLLMLLCGLMLQRHDTKGKE